MGLFFSFRPTELHESPSRQSAPAATVRQREEVGTHLRPGEHHSLLSASWLAPLPLSSVAGRARRFRGWPRFSAGCARCRREFSSIPEQWREEMGMGWTPKETVSDLQPEMLFRSEGFHRQERALPLDRRGDLNCVAQVEQSNYGSWHQRQK